MVVIVVVAAWLIRRTVFGRQILAIGGNEAAARLAGIPVDRGQALVYFDQRALRGHCRPHRDRHQLRSGRQSRRASAWSSTRSPPWRSAARCSTGGRADVVGTLIGALIIQLVRYTLLANGVPDAAALVVKAGLIILAVWLQRQA